MCAIMPERLANTDPYTQIAEAVGSGPFRFRADERVQGSRFVYERFADYKPRQDGEPDWTSGPKVVHFDRVEWHIIPDPATAAAALQAGEVDWWELPTGDLLPMLERKDKIKVKLLNPMGNCQLLRPNHLFPPFDNPALRRALLGAIDQAEFMTAMMGTDTSLWKVPCGFFPPMSPWASDVGMSLLTEKPDYDAVRRNVRAAGYKGEKIVLMVPQDVAAGKAESDVAAEMMKRVGMDVDYQAVDWGTIVQRRASKSPPDQGGWNVFCTGFNGLDFLTPATHAALRGNDGQAWFGWPTSPRIEELRDAWLDATDFAGHKKLAVEIQAQAFEDVPYLPLGLNYFPTALRANLTDMPNGIPVFWSVRRT
jgi:peptide/nickel transport system substrate-binding protein